MVFKSKKLIIFKRFSLQRKKPEFCNICEQESLKCLKAISSVKTKIFETRFWNIYTGLGYFILTTARTPAILLKRDSNTGVFL